MKKLITTLFIPITGLLAIIWFLIRVIPKPSRATYPCVKASYPLASAFVVWLIGTFSSAIIFKKAKDFMIQKRYVLFSLTLLASISIGTVSYLQNSNDAYAVIESPSDGPNEPMGVGKGVMPGRVVWIHNPDATDENMKGTNGDYWYKDTNTNQNIVNQMVSQGLQEMTNTTSDQAAWDAIFKHHNDNRGKGKVGYKAGEKIVIKINLNSNDCNYNTDNYSRWNHKNIDTSPQVVYAILNQLVNVVGVAQQNIGFGDPGKNVDDIYYTKFRSQFPNVVYWGKGNGRTALKRSTKKAIYTSDNTLSDYLPKEYQEAEYMINIPVFKKHHRAGISLTSKNHFGTFVRFRGSAFDWHFSLPAADGNAKIVNGDYGLYRCFVDIMGHKDLGGKTVLYLVDGLWSSTNWAHPPIKWQMAPFNNDYPSSLFFSMDPVAIQSVGYDFLFNEFGFNHPTEGSYDRSDNTGPFSHYAGTDDFLHQGASSKNWPKGLTYDPENDGTPLPSSMGVHEHWNNPVDKKYSRNLGLNEGIELVYNHATSVENNSDQLVFADNFELDQNYPNPFNPSTHISYRIKNPGHIHLAIYNSNGQLVRTLVNSSQAAGDHVEQWNGMLQNGQKAASGIYLYKLNYTANGKTFSKAAKMTLTK